MYRSQSLFCRAPSQFVIAGSGYYELDAVREESYAEKIAGEAREFRHPPSPLQLEVNQVLTVTEPAAGTR